MITLRLLGPLEVLVEGAPAPPELLWRKNVALLIYLARSPRRTRAREHLIGLFWADKPEAKARRSLNEALRVLRKFAGKSAIRTRGTQLSVEDRAVVLDTDAFEARVKGRDWPGAAALVSGEFLEGFSVPDSSEFDSWLAAERDHWRRRTVEVLVRCAEEQLGQGALDQATDAADRALALDPVSGGAVRILMRSLAVAGDRAGALEVFERHASRLAAELNTRPDAETMLLAERVRRERSWNVAPPRAARASAAESRRAPLVGRSLDLARLVRVWSECREQRRAAVSFIEGDGGAGKTRLAEEFAARARLDGAAVSVVRAVEGDQDQAGSALIGLARGGLLDAAGLAAAPPEALAAFGARVPEWADRFPAARPREGAPLGVAVVEALRAVAAEQPTVALIDDAQWVDRESLLALGRALRDLARAPLCVVFTTTPRPLRPELEGLRTRLRRELLGVTVRLSPLSQDDLRVLARWAFPRYSETELDRVVRRIATDSAGLPLLAVELFHAVALGLDLSTTGAAWPAPAKTLLDSLPGDLPDAVVGAIRVGFRRLTPPAQQVLKAAAVLGERVPADVLGRATALAGPELTAALDQLEWERWLTFEPRGYAFLARIVRQVVERDMVLAGQRERILQAVSA